jgi:Iap family predicted aminopeptidase
MINEIVPYVFFSSILILVVGTYLLTVINSKFSKLSRSFRISEVFNKVTGKKYYIIEQQDWLFRIWSPVYDKNRDNILKYCSFRDAEIDLMVWFNNSNKNIEKTKIKEYK